MPKRLLLEICVETLDAAVAAARAGADRIELCDDLSVGGVTPNPTLVREVRRKVSIPIHVMIRPRGGNFCYSESEFSQMERDIAQMKSCGADGIVLGLLCPDGRADIARTKILVERARPLPVTFHRAFDEVIDIEQALHDVVSTGATRILTSGGENSAEDGLSVLAKLVRKASDKIQIMPGGGITSLNIAGIASGSGAREFHSGLTSVLAADPANYETFESEIRNLVMVLDRFTNGSNSAL